MRPFQALYFLRHGFKRIVTVLVMVALTGFLYVGGSYLSNINVEYLKTVERHQEYAYVMLFQGTADNGQKEAFLKEVEADEMLRMFPVGENYYRFPTVLTFENGDYSFSYGIQDFLWVNERMGWVKDVSLVQNNTLFVTRRYAEYLNLSEGELVEGSREEITFYYGEKPFTVRFMEGEDFAACLITEESKSSSFYHLTWSEKGNREILNKRIEELRAKYKDMSIHTYEERLRSANENFSINGIIFLSIIVVVTCVFFITVNAVLVGIYDKRKSEFLLYDNLGISRKRIKGKVISELALFSLIGMFFGAVLIVVTIAFLNRFVYGGTGLQLYYYHPWAAWSFVICNGMILLPSIAMRLRWFKRIDKMV